MSKQHVLDIIQTAQGRAAAIHSTAPGFAFNEHLSVEGYQARIDAARDEVFQYIALQSQLNAQRGRMMAAGRLLAGWSNRMLCAFHSSFGKDSPQYQAVAATKSSPPRRRSRKRRGAAIAMGRPATGPMPAAATARGPVEDAALVSHAEIGDPGRADVGREDTAGTEPPRNVVNEMESARRIEVLAPRERQASVASPANEADRREEIDGAVKMAEKDVEAPQPKALAIDATDTRRAVAEALAGPIPLDRSCLLDLLPQLLRPSLVTGLAPARASLTPRLAEASASQSLPSQLNRPGLAVPRSIHEVALEDGTDPEANLNRVHPPGADDAEDEGEQDGKEGGDGPGTAKASVFHGRVGAPWRGCVWDGVRRLETTRRATGAMLRTTPKGILKE